MNNFRKIAEGFALAVFEEFIVCIVFSALALYTKAEFFMLFWLGAFITCTLHFIVHIIQAIIVRKYIPALMTSIICLPISIWIISECISTLDCQIIKIVLFSLIGVIVVLLNLKFAQSLIGKFTKILD
ncbi:MAG: HXXEE domain-containing protein [Lachnospiraceae bacterium]|nr:HXXEE domain-containing protein [Lachnospiraceae bacterium]